jgi:hypothetical protein
MLHAGTCEMVIGGSAVVGAAEVAENRESHDEAAGVIVDLFENNKQLMAENKRLTSEVELLQRKLAEARLQLDLLGGKSNEQLGEVEKKISVAEIGDPAQLKVLEVNRDMMVAVTSGGIRSGMKIGMVFSVVRDNAALAVIRLTDVRENIAGGLIEDVYEDRFPIAGDRLILKKTQD